uniref:Uncharacterized protein n=1 Tax=Ditylenchus dipsaci TaxID=166011 RepID=A0A915DS99_9BILA
MAKALVELGESQADLDIMKKMSILEDTKNGDSKAFKEKRYQKANVIYQQILKLPCISPEDRGTISSNLSASYFSSRTQEYLKKATKYADLAITVRPTWWRGYHRLGRVYLKRGKLDKAEKF